eukprot:m.196086 g.196086  ORF g.196086 m.196086 type:complete len:516 (-) comp18684_c1_seq2:135-1682(-)
MNTTATFLRVIRYVGVERSKYFVDSHVSSTRTGFYNELDRRSKRKTYKLFLSCYSLNQSDVTFVNLHLKMLPVVSLPRPGQSEATILVHGIQAKLQLQAAREMENAHMNQLRQAEQLYDAMYGPLRDATALDAAIENPAAGGSTSIQEILREIAKTKARIGTQKQSLLGVKARRVRLEETYIQKQDELQNLVEQLEKTEGEFEKRRRSALQINHLDKSIKGKLSEQSAMLAVVTDQMASSASVLEQQRRDLIKIHGEANVRKAALIHDQSSIKDLRAKHAMAQQTVRAKQTEAQRLEAELRNVQSLLVAEKEGLAALSAQKNLSRQQLAVATSKIAELNKGAAAITDELKAQRATIARLRAQEDVLHQAVQRDVAGDGVTLYDTVLPAVVTDGGSGSGNHAKLHGMLDLSFLDDDDDDDMTPVVRPDRRSRPFRNADDAARQRSNAPSATHVMQAYNDIAGQHALHGQGKDYNEVLSAYYALNVGTNEAPSERLRREAVEAAEEILAHSTTDAIE